MAATFRVKPGPYKTRLIGQLAIFLLMRAFADLIPLFLLLH